MSLARRHSHLFSCEKHEAHNLQRQTFCKREGIA